MRPRPLPIPCTHVFLFVLILDTFPTFHFTFVLRPAHKFSCRFFFLFDLTKNESQIPIQMRAKFPNIGLGVSYEHTKVESNERSKNKKQRDRKRGWKKLAELMKQNLKAYDKFCQHVHYKLGDISLHLCYGCTGSVYPSYRGKLIKSSETPSVIKPSQCIIKTAKRLFLQANRIKQTATTYAVSIQHRVKWKILILHLF